MLAAPVPPPELRPAIDNVADAQECIVQLTARVEVLGKHLDVALRDRSKSTLANRILSAKFADDLVTNFGECARSLALRGVAVDKNIYALLQKTMESTLRAFFASWPSKLDTVEDAAVGHAEMQRIVAEVRAHFQVLDVKDPRMHITQTIWALAAANFSDSARKKYLTLALEELDRDRSGVPHGGNLAAAKKAVSMHLSLLPSPDAKASYVEAMIVKQLLSSIRAFYEKATIGSDLEAYLSLVDAMIVAELHRVEAALGADVAPQLLARAKREMQQALLGGRALHIVTNKDQGVAAQLQYPALQPAKFWQLFNVLDFSKPAVELMRKEVSASVMRAAATLPTPLSVDDVIQLRGAYAELLSGITAEHQLDFHIELQDALAGFLSRNSFDQQLALHFDFIAKSKPANTAEQLARSALVLSLVKDGLQFLQLYRAQLASRLTLRAHTHTATEARALQCLASHFGAQLVHPLQVMLREAQGGHPMLCNDLVWPHAMALADAELDLGSADGPLRAAFAAFEAEVAELSGPPARIAVAVDLALSTAEFDLAFPGCPHTCTAHGSVPQLLVLQALAASPVPLAIADVASRVVANGAGEESVAGSSVSHVLGDLALVVKTLVTSQLVLEQPSVATQQVRYAINAQYMAGAASKKKVALPTTGITKVRMH